MAKEKDTPPETPPETPPVAPVMYRVVIIQFNHPSQDTARGYAFDEIVDGARFEDLETLIELGALTPVPAAE